MNVEIPFVEDATVLVLTVTGEVRVGPQAETEVSETHVGDGEVGIDFGVALERRLTVHQRAVELVSRIESVLYNKG